MPEAPRPLRVLEVAARFFPELGGTETHVYEVSRRLAARPDIEVTVFGSDRSGRLPPSERMEGFDVVRRRSWPRERDYYASPGLWKVVTSGQWDLVHVQGVHTLVPVVAMLAARRAGIPYVLTFHTGGHSSGLRTGLRDVQWRVLRPLLRRAERLVAVSRFERRRFEQATGIPPSRFTVIRNGGALPAVTETVEPVPGRVLSVGRLERYKGHHRVVDALPHLLRTVPEAHLVVLGGGPFEPELRAHAQALGMAERVTIRQVPPGDRAAMARELRSGGVLAAMSDYEAHPVAVMEALTLGVPVVGYDVAGTGDLVEDGLVTPLAPGAEPAVAAAVLAGVLESGRGPDLVIPPLPTWETCAEQLAELYHDVTALRRA